MMEGRIKYVRVTGMTADRVDDILEYDASPCGSTRVNEP